MIASIEMVAALRILSAISIPLLTAQGKTKIRPCMASPGSANWCGKGLIPMRRYPIGHFVIPMAIC
jgi:hypothetical protein